MKRAAPLLLLLATIPASAQTGLLVPTSTGRPDPRVLSLREMTVDVGIARGTVEAVLAADDAALAAAAELWSRIEEFWGQWEPEVLLAVARALRALFARADAEGSAPYALVTV